MKRTLLLFALIEALVIAGLVLFLCSGYARWALWALGAVMAAELLLGLWLLVALRNPKGR